MLMGVVCPQNSSPPPVRCSARIFARALQRLQPSWPTRTGSTVVVSVVIMSSRCLEERSAGPGESRRTASRTSKDQTGLGEPRARELVGKPHAVDDQVNRFSFRFSITYH